MVLKFAEAFERASPFFSFVIGLGISVLLFHRNFETIRRLALPLKDVTDRVVQVDGKCYRYRVEDARCEIPSST
jgi:hypothetical protein